MAVHMSKKGSSGGSAPSWMKKGKEAQKALQKEEEVAKAKDEEKGKLFRFWMPKDTQTSITFLDGVLDDEGALDILLYYEHNVYMNNSWKNWFVCTAEDEPCPICEGGERSSSLVGALTIIDHTEWTGNNNKLHRDERKLFVAKRDTINALQMLATKRGGLAGCTFDVARTGDKSPGCGNVFDFTEKRSLAELAKIYKEVANGPADYGKEITYRDAATLRKLGFGAQPIGAESGGGGEKGDYSNDL